MKRNKRTAYQTKVGGLFFDELNESCVELSCPLKNHYYVIAYNGIDLTITCYDENGNPTPERAAVNGVNFARCF